MFGINNIKTSMVWVIAVTLTTICSCSGNSPQTKQFSQQGMADAMQLVEKAPSLSSTAMEKELLEIRAKEYDYRREVGDAQADAYIAAFEAGIKQADDSLAYVLFEPTPPNTEEYAN